MKKIIYFSIRNFTVILFITISIINMGCKKDDNPDDSNQGMVIPLETDLRVYEYTLLRTRLINLESIGYEGTVNGIEINLERINDSTLMFIMPDIAGNTANLNAEIEDFEYNVSFNIIEHEIIIEPINYVVDFLSIILNSENEFDYITNEVNEVLEDFYSLSDEEQMQTAKFIAANRAILDELDPIFSDLETFSVENKSFCSQPYRTASMKCLIGDYTVCLVRLATPVVVGALLGSTASPAGTFIGGMVGIMIVKTFYKYRLEQASAIWENISKRTFEPSDIIFSSSKNSFENEVENDVNISIKYGNIQNKQYSQSWLSLFIGLFSKFQEMWNTYIGTMTPNYAQLIQETDVSDNFNFLSLSVSGNPNVSGSLSGTVNNPKIMFNTNANENQNFSFKLTYNDGEFIKEKSFQATLIVDEDPLIAEFTMSPSSAIINQSIFFNDNSIGNPNSWAWSFGDGSSSNNQFPTHSYSNIGTYTIRLIVQRDNLRDTAYNTITIGQLPVAGFSGSPTIILEGQSVSFSDASYSYGQINNWHWSFGDGGSSNAQNPTHVYSNYGYYSVSLTVSDQYGSNTLDKHNYIFVDSIPEEKSNIRNIRF